MGIAGEKANAYYCPYDLLPYYHSIKVLINEFMDSSPKSVLYLNDGFNSVSKKRIPRVNGFGLTFLSEGRGEELEEDNEDKEVTFHSTVVHLIEKLF